MQIAQNLLPEKGGDIRVTNRETGKEDIFISLPKKALESTQKPFEVTWNLHESLLKTVEKMDKDSGLGKGKCFVFLKCIGIKIKIERETIK